MTETHTASSTYGDENPHDRDVAKAEQVFFQDGVCDQKKLSEHIIMGRRHSVRHHKEIDDMKNVQREKELEDQEMKTAIIGNKEFGQVGIVERVTDQGKRQEEIATKQSIILGIGMMLVIAIPIIMEAFKG